MYSSTVSESKLLIEVCGQVPRSGRLKLRGKKALSSQ
jgi:hypothetical protein